MQRATSSAGGTIAATRAVLMNDDVTAACHLAGGTHHAFYDYGEGITQLSLYQHTLSLHIMHFMTMEKVSLNSLHINTPSHCISCNPLHTTTSLNRSTFFSDCCI